MTKYKLNARIFGAGGIIVIIIILGIPALLFLVGDTGDFTLPANIVQPTGDFPRTGIMFLAIAGAVGVILYIRIILKSGKKNT